MNMGVKIKKEKKKIVVARELANGNAMHVANLVYQCDSMLKKRQRQRTANTTHNRELTRTTLSHDTLTYFRARAHKFFPITVRTQKISIHIFICNKSKQAEKMARYNEMVENKKKPRTSIPNNKMLI